MNDLNKLTNEELRTILLTCDGRGKEVKQEALDILIQRGVDNIIIKAALES